ncbi:15582_t:CDS:2 [Cetraspora pellucida]|uniref:15582_t:CDS:1 n=1 Tax=Cetraspora pellucida TaxID=1433469 RepID=A0A9N8WGJ3_9GLOM|nr:15582_t:CDS:2 [Cetraspora pellucida]
MKFPSVSSVAFFLALTTTGFAFPHKRGELKRDANAVPSYYKSYDDYDSYSYGYGGDYYKRDAAPSYYKSYDDYDSYSYGYGGDYYKLLRRL